MVKALMLSIIIKVVWASMRWAGVIRARNTTGLILARVIWVRMIRIRMILARTRNRMIRVKDFECRINSVEDLESVPFRVKDLESRRSSGKGFECRPMCVKDLESRQLRDKDVESKFFRVKSCKCRPISVKVSKYMPFRIQDDSWSFL